MPPVFIEDEPQERRLKKVNQYLLAESLGKGAQSKVFLAIDNENGSPYAAKAINLSKSNKCCDAGMALEREVRILHMLKHPNVIKLKEVLYCHKKETAYLVMEWAPCGSLQDMITNLGGLPEDYIKSVFAQVVAGLTYLHSQAIIHRDIKPSNIFIFPDGTVKIGDFGIGHSFESAVNIMGSPAYQAPEFFEDCEEEEEESDTIDPIKEDVWSLGVTLYQSIFGHLPFIGENAFEIAYNINNSPLHIPDTISNELRDLLTRMLQINPNNRASLEEIAAHPFLSNAGLTSFEKFAREIPHVSDVTDVKYYAADVCGSDYSFCCTKRSVSWPVFIKGTGL